METPDDVRSATDAGSAYMAGPCWVLIGPTASGKTAVALELARRHSLEVVSVDSMQVYRGMDIGTAKPTPDERARVPHHLIDVLDPSQRCNVGVFCRMAHEAMDEIRARGRRPLIVGGTPLYLKGLIWGLTDGPAAAPDVRARLEAEGRDHGSAVLHERLRALDPEAAARIHPNDVHRLVRALEVLEVTGQPISRTQCHFDGPPRLPQVMVGLRWPRAQLYARIEERVDTMMERGLLDEVKSLQGRMGGQARQALGYKELTSYLAGQCSLEEAVRRIKRDTRRFAKHQLTWFRRFAQVHWIDAAQCASVQELATKCEILFVSLA